MKKIISMALTLAMLIGAFPVKMVLAEETTLNEVLSYDFDTDAAEFKTQIGYYNTIAGKSYGAGSDKTDTTYGIGEYKQFSDQAYLPFVVDNSSGTPVMAGIERFQTPNKYLEIEYDYLPIAHTGINGSGFNTLGMGAVTYDNSGALDNVYYFGSAYHVYTPDSEETIWTYEGGKSAILNENGPTMDKWHRVKLVAQLTTSTLQSGSETKYTVPTTKCIKVYVDGELINEKYYKSRTLSDEYVRALRIHSNYGRAGIDNLTVKTYQASDAPVEKGKLITAIRDFEKNYPEYTEYSEYSEAVTLIASAKAVYEDANADENAVSAAVSNVEAATKLMVPFKTVMSYDFEDDYSDYLTNVKKTYNSSDDQSQYSNKQTAEKNNIYGIGNYEYRSVNFNIPVTAETETIAVGGTDAVVPKGIEIEGKNLYVQTEFDYKVIEGSKQTADYATAGMLLTGLKKDTSGNTTSTLLSAQKTFGTIYHQFEKATKDAVFVPYSYTTAKAVTTNGTYLADAKEDEWQRVRIVTQVTNEDGEMSTSNKMYFYVDGELIKTGNLNSEVVNYSDGFIRFIRLHYSNNANQAIDNLSVTTYRDLEKAPADKGGLVAAIRNFEKEYAGYELGAATTLINEAKAVYENSDATDVDVEAAIGKVNQAVALFNPENGAAIFEKDGKIVVNGKFNSDGSINENYMTILAFFDENDRLSYAVTSQQQAISEGENSIYLESDMTYFIDKAMAYTWTTETFTPLCESVSYEVN